MDMPRPRNASRNFGVIERGVKLQARFQCSGVRRDGENMPNPHLQIHPVFIPNTSRVKIWDFRLRISDLWNRYALSI